MNRHELFRRMRKSKFFVIGAFMVVFLMVTALLASTIAPHNPTRLNLSMRLTPPDYFANGWGGHPFGTDALGQCVFSRLLVGSTISFQIAITVVVLTFIIGTILGVISGFFGGVVDTIIMRIGDIQLSIPQLIFAIAIMAVLGNSMFNLIVVLVINGWVQFARLVRSSVMMIRNTEFVNASKALGASNLRIMFVQILPNVMTSLIIVTSQEFGRVILVEAALSFIGLGVPPPAPSWGGMIAQGREYLATSPWVVIAPGMALMVAVFAFNFLGNGIRDVMDPKNKN